MILEQFDVLQRVLQYLREGHQNQVHRFLSIIFNILYIQVQRFPETNRVQY